MLAVKVLHKLNMLANEMIDTFKDIQLMVWKLHFKAVGLVINSIDI